MSATAAHQLFASVTQNATPAPADLTAGRVALTVAATVPALNVAIGYEAAAVLVVTAFELIPQVPRSGIHSTTFAPISLPLSLLVKASMKADVAAFERRRLFSCAGGWPA